MQPCVRCGEPATHSVTWPFTGVTEPYCKPCLEEYEAGAQEIDEHEARVAEAGLPASCCPRPSVAPITP